MNKCEKCGSLHYRADPCRPKLERAILPEQVEPDDTSKPAARSNAPKRNRNEYHRVNMVKWRAKKKAEKIALVNETTGANNG